jgi:hypothetical protein
MMIGLFGFVTPKENILSGFVVAANTVVVANIIIVVVDCCCST